jgi:F-type H+-transporting ATP synthase subunit e
MLYGAYHQLSISAREKVQAEQKEYNHKESLIRQAKEEWAKSHPSEQPKAASGGTSYPGPRTRATASLFKTCANPRL